MKHNQSECNGGSKPKTATAASILPCKHNKKDHSKTLHVKVVTDPGPNDVICGRGKSIAKNIGNLRLHATVKAHRETYQRASKQEKTRIASNVVKLVQSCGGRFLQKTDSSLKNKAYYAVVDYKFARDKVSHIFRKNNLKNSDNEGPLPSDSEGRPSLQDLQEQMKRNELIHAQQSIFLDLIKEDENKKAEVNTLTTDNFVRRVSYDCEGIDSTRPRP